ncbi:pentapeptide repeat-containing protein [Nocardioides sp. cx-173]|uniref:pentapeptide repeat-containing protein n=1 Tax=Nocardioides sp. cx-173 TaxID=2898796 RepID=UPI001E4E6481|nr:pentapeptide repeat-containing protein [Nocardioides sp. cx-173]MCD4526960.1 pentapeptide repeat-containing protein [Nocardioides sp. cx-173]UGB41105.1 pentapeptide repeat-containing protein [Nocardioides sp. cx-173]
MAKTARPSTHPPHLDPVVHRALGAGSSDLLVADADLHGLSFDDLALPELALGGASVDGCRFAGVAAREADWRSTRLRETTFDRLDVPVVRAPRGVWRDVLFSGARLGSVEAYETDWHSVHFVGCKLSFVNLRGAELLDVAFTDCVVEELDLLSTTARRVAFRGTRLGRLNAQQARLEHVDLRGCELEAVDGLDGLRGATISPAQLDLLAPLFAQDKGLKVEER